MCEYGMRSTMIAGGPKIEQEQAKGILHVFLLGDKTQRNTNNILMLLFLENRICAIGTILKHFL